MQDLYAASKDNQAFLHARLALGDDVPKPYKATIDRWVWPDLFKNQDTSVSQAKEAISDYKKAIGRVEGLAELMVFYCERAAGFSDDVGLQDEGYFDALVRMFEQALKVIHSLPEDGYSSSALSLPEMRVGLALPSSATLAPGPDNSSHTQVHCARSDRSETVIAFQRNATLEHARQDHGAGGCLRLRPHPVVYDVPAGHRFSGLKIEKFS